MKTKSQKIEKLTIANYQKLAMKTCLPTAKNWEYCYTLIVSELGEAYGKWGKKFRDGEFDKDKLTDELGDVFWGIALACQLSGESFEKHWQNVIKNGLKVNDAIMVATILPSGFSNIKITPKIEKDKILAIIAFSIQFAKECGIRPFDCLKKNIAKLADRQKRGVLKGNGDNR